MEYIVRASIYKEIEEIRGRPLIVYVTSLRQNASAQIAPDVISEFARQILCIDAESKQIDVLIVSNGGDPTVAWRLVSMLRERFDDVTALLPFTAYSAATLFAMGANSVIMHPFANLGPVDPQLTATRQFEDGRSQVNQFGAEDLVQYLAFVREDVGVTDQEQIENAFELLCKDVGAISVGVAKRSTQLSLSLGEQLLSLHMKDRNEARTITEALSRSFYHHGYPLGRTEAKKIGLPVENADPVLEKLLWDVWLSFEGEMKCSEPFNPLSLVMDNAETAELLRPVQQVEMPVNLPPDLITQVYQSVLQQISTRPVLPVEYELVQAAVESRRCKSEFRTKGIINAVRRPDMMINLNTTTISQKWNFTTT